MDHDLALVRAIFDEVIEAPPENRPALLAERCGDDAALRSRVEALIATAESDDPFLSQATRARPEASTLALPPLAEHPGTRIGPYKLLQEIGEGGFGVVFMAEQDQPVRRRVALKIIKLGMDTRQVVARFEQERQALALMDHPNIAKVLDAGATESGRPYFVMEYVKGDPITAFADAHKLSLPDRLEVFAQVCAAVQHAHTKGIIHRDLKPRNILVSVSDGKPFAKVIDFGIAKATGARLTEKTLFTEHRQLIGTPEYMSPEQAEGSLDIDTRTDVYSLGVLLYELLTGATPFDAERLRSAAYAEMQRIIKEEDPPTPSMRLSRDLDSLAATAAARQTDPAKLGALVKGELDWIVMKALDKDRAQRYESPSQLAADVRRHLSGEAVVAAPPSGVYRLRKFVRRNRGPVLGGSAVAIALVLGIAGTTSQWWRATTNERNLSMANERLREQTKAARLAQASLVMAAWEDAWMDDVFDRVGESPIATVAALQEAVAARREYLGPNDAETIRAEMGLAYRTENASDEKFEEWIVRRAASGEPAEALDVTLHSGLSCRYFRSGDMQRCFAEIQYVANLDPAAERRRVHKTDHAPWARKPGWQMSILSEEPNAGALKKVTISSLYRTIASESNDLGERSAAVEKAEALDAEAGHSRHPGNLAVRATLVIASNDTPEGRALASQLLDQAEELMRNPVWADNLECKYLIGDAVHLIRPQPTSEEVVAAAAARARLAAATILMEQYLNSATSFEKPEELVRAVISERQRILPASDPLVLQSVWDLAYGGTPFDVRAMLWEQTLKEYYAAGGTPTWQSLNLEAEIALSMPFAGQADRVPGALAQLADRVPLVAAKHGSDPISDGVPSWNRLVWFWSKEEIVDKPEQDRARLLEERVRSLTAADLRQICVRERRWAFPPEWTIALGRNGPNSDFEAALQRTEKALTQMPESLPEHETRALLLYRIGKYDESLGAIRRAIALIADAGVDPHPEQQLILALIQSTLGHQNDSRAALHEFHSIMAEPRGAESWAKVPEAQLLLDETKLLPEAQSEQFPK